MLNRWCFGFNVANYVLLSIPDSKVRIPGISLFWQCCYMDISFVDGFGIITNESLKAGIITFLSCITPIGNFKYSFLIGFDEGRVSCVGFNPTEFLRRWRKSACRNALLISRTARRISLSALKTKVRITPISRRLKTWKSSAICRYQWISAMLPLN